MDDRPRAVVVCVHVLRHRLVTTGTWCDRCLLPSVVTIELLLTIDHHPPRYAHLTACTDCGEIHR